MTSSSARFLRSSVLGLALASLTIGAFGVACGRQLEGERCSLDNGDNDCDSSENLVCTPASSLRNGADGVPRCCPESASDASSDRCTRRSGGGSTGGSTGAGGDDGAGGEGGTDPGDNGAGESCDYNTDCTAPLICGPSGKCQSECNGDRDCSGGRVCSDEKTCVEP